MFETITGIAAGFANVAVIALACLLALAVGGALLQVVLDWAGNVMDALLRRIFPRLTENTRSGISFCVIYAAVMVAAVRFL